VTNLDFNEYLNSTGKQKLFPIHQKMSEVDYFDEPEDSFDGPEDILGGYDNFDAYDEMQWPDGED
jgi:hypothetical protein